MSSCICFNISNPRIDYRNLGENKGSLVQFETSSELDIDSLNSFVLYSDNSKYGEFVTEGGIINVSLEDKYDNQYLYRVDLEVKNTFSGDRTLDDFMFSLEAIYNYGFPSRHFSRYFRYLSETDYNTIKDGNIFIARTFFGKIFNVLPNYHKITLINHIISQQGMDFFTKRDYRSALDGMRKYIINEIEGRGKYLTASASFLRTLNLQETDINDIGFLSSESEKPDYLLKQANIFDELQAFQKESSIWDKIDNEISDNYKVQENFNYNFRYKEWPIFLENYEYIY